MSRRWTMRVCWKLTVTDIFNLDASKCIFVRIIKMLSLIMGYEKLPATPPLTTDDDEQCSRGTSEETARAEEAQLLGLPKSEFFTRWQKIKPLSSCWWIMAVMFLVVSNVITLSLLFLSVRRIHSLQAPTQKSWLPPEGKIFCLHESTAC